MPPGRGRWLALKPAGFASPGNTVTTSNWLRALACRCAANGPSSESHYQLRKLLYLRRWYSPLVADFLPGAAITGRDAGDPGDEVHSTGTAEGHLADADASGLAGLIVSAMISGAILKPCRSGRCRSSSACAAQYPRHGGLPDSGRDRRLDAMEFSSVAVFLAGWRWAGVPGSVGRAATAQGKG